MLVDIIDDQAYLAAGQEKLLHEVIEAAAKYLKLPGGIELDLSIVSNEEIQALNRDYRGLDKPTDVLSFALTEVSSEYDVDFAHLDLAEEAEETEDLEETEFEEEEAIPQHLGDIIISYPRAQEQAQDYGHSLDRELAFLAVHGFLHLNGYDHQTEEEAQEMFRIQEEVLTTYGLTR
ncbi:rRNA maturation RNase YbeY [Abiotrophia defectiva]|uniref:Endoribonuclease YbeY n=1 Tax=Abiotrophia defectiva ATCC 49176 TaxID=592010 RepID=W1Q2B1_ABIDE|nr:rRNA maturation RNase YbeY [Abiotrophia defectiva]ESK65235.1 translation metalloprotein YbeY [Abiotrophia defectiva ATCC 49176]MCY7224710.1 rRNA maturation RNase YbeY [Abiotrophia defectiva]QKH47630.1 rRNA maturation RNase YbeY [Abiotrophia defectiva]